MSLLICLSSHIPGKYQQMEGVGAPRNVIIEFATYQDAVGCYESQEYQAAAIYREKSGIASITIVEGV